MPTGRECFNIPKGGFYMSNKIITYSKQFIDPINPEKDAIVIEDIAHALSRICRANGQMPIFYSVASHSICCCREAIARGYSKKLCLALLMHDASEGYLSDIVRPVKRALTSYLEIEKRMQNTIYEKFVGEITDDDRKIIAEIDDAMLYLEFFELAGEEVCEKKPLVAEHILGERPFGEVEAEFIALYNELKKED